MYYTTMSTSHRMYTSRTTARKALLTSIPISPNRNYRLATPTFNLAGYRTGHDYKRHIHIQDMY